MEVAADEDKARIHQWDGKLIREWELFRFRAGVDPATVEFDPGYAPEAIASYARFVAMRGAGTLPAGVRFQVCLPTPMAIGYWFVSPSSRPDFFAAYERAFWGRLRHRDRMRLGPRRPGPRPRPPRQPPHRAGRPMTRVHLAA